jgi:hypothetical protein
MSAALGLKQDKQEITKLNLDKDRQVLDGLTFEVTPPTDPDAYQGWWISVYDEGKINMARASEEEMKRISVSKQELARQAKVIGGWTAEEAAKARPYYPPPAPNVSTSQANLQSTASSYTGSSYSGGGSVYVHGYTRKDGTYVHSYTRSAPRR